MKRIKPEVNGKRLIVSQHAQKRAKKRLNMSPYNLTNIAKKAYLSGVGAKDAVGRLKKYLYAHSTKGEFAKIYGHYVFVFENRLLKTVWMLPNDLWKYWDNREVV